MTGHTDPPDAASDAGSGLTGIGAALQARGIRRLRHFTTNAGLTGIFATGEVRSRNHLRADDYLDRIYLPNCEIRHDPAWTGYVSISVTDINASFFAICSGNPKWHLDLDGFWAIFELDPMVATHEGVYFTTTNNRYSNVGREVGVEGFEAMFAPEVYPYRPLSAHPAITRAGLDVSQPTDAQAEVLYPGVVGVEHVTAVLVATDTDAHSVRAQLGYFEAMRPELSHIEVRVDPDAFRNRLVSPR